MSANKEKIGKAWSNFDTSKIKTVDQFNQGYLDFLNRIKTERESVKFIEEAALRNGFKPLEEVAAIKPGARIIISKKNKVAALFIAGGEPLSEGFNLVASHIDTPRIDLKANPLYEADGLALFKTHYYGGIKKYQWTAIPLALCGEIGRASCRERV